VAEFIEEIRSAARGLAEFGVHLFNPTIRLGVTGLSRAGKTVFITALVHGLVRSGRFPIFEAPATGRIARAYLAPRRCAVGSTNIEFRSSAVDGLNQKP
jgi:uncharacterized protein